MFRPMKLMITGAVGLLLAATPAGAKPTKPKAGTQTAVIVNSGSTNYFGYKITVTMDAGGFSVTSASNNGKDNFSAYGTSRQREPRIPRFFADLKSAMPLTSLPARRGVRSASFGTQTRIIYKGQTSPDLTSATDPRSVKLKADISDFVKEYGAKNSPRHPSL